MIRIFTCTALSAGWRSSHCDPPAFAPFQGSSGSPFSRQPQTMTWTRIRTGNDKLNWIINQIELNYHRFGIHRECDPASRFPFHPHIGSSHPFDPNITSHRFYLRNTGSFVWWTVTQPPVRYCIANKTDPKYNQAHLCMVSCHAHPGQGAWVPLILPQASPPHPYARPSKPNPIVAPLQLQQSP